MFPSATFCNLPLSTTYDVREEISKLIGMVLKTGIQTVRSVASGLLTVPGADTGFSVQMDMPIAPSLPFDVVLGRNWMQYCRETVPKSRLSLSSSIIDLRRSSDFRRVNFLCRVPFNTVPTRTPQQTSQWGLHLRKEVPIWTGRVGLPLLWITRMILRRFNANVAPIAPIAPVAPRS
ncbi:hypothetical protein B0H14DRAFT_3126196 [Mycena olivaceomarginata]|nr:hypothetical protein B0H14DRAFT_3126196 [Mycena olivaceomarginata]